MVEGGSCVSSGCVLCTLCECVSGADLPSISPDLSVSVCCWLAVYQTQCPPRERTECTDGNRAAAQQSTDDDITPACMVPHSRNTELFFPYDNSERPCNDMHTYSSHRVHTSTCNVLYSANWSRGSRNNGSLVSVTHKCSHRHGPAPVGHLLDWEITPRSERRLRCKLLMWSQSLAHWAGAHHNKR